MPNGNRYVLILGRNAQEAATYARRADLPNFTYRAVSSASSIRKIQVADVHILPGFHQRPDKHAILKELKWGRDIAYFDVEMPDPAEAPPTDQGDGMGEQLEIEFVMPKRRKSFDPVVEIVSEVPTGRLAVLEALADDVDEADTENVPPQPATESPAHVGPAADVAVERAEGDRTAMSKPRRRRCKTCGHLTVAAYEVDPEGHRAEAHTGEFF